MVAAQVGELLQDYAARGVFRSFGAVDGGRQRAEFRSLWHRGHLFSWQFDRSRPSLRIPCVLPGVPADSAMYRELRAWLRERQSPDLPAHRRCDASRLRLRTYNRGGEVALTATILDGDIEYAVHALVALVNELYLDFLSSGLYYEWLVDTFDLDPDWPW